MKKQKETLQTQRTSGAAERRRWLATGVSPWERVDTKS